MPTAMDFIEPVVVSMAYTTSSKRPDSHSVSEKFLQMASASLRAYLDGPDTVWPDSDNLDNRLTAGLTTQCRRRSQCPSSQKEWGASFHSRAQQRRLVSPK